MNIQHLKYVIEVERTGSITQAAENLFMNQPNLSKVIRELEDEMGFTIFKRSSRGIELTARGATFLDYAKQVVSLINEMAALNKPHDSSQQRLSLAVPADGCIAEAFIRFMMSLDHSCPMDLNFMETGMMDTIDAVLRGRAGLGIIRYKEVNEPQVLRHLAEKELKSSLINEFACCILVAKDSPLAERSIVDMSELIHYAEIVRNDVTIPQIRSSGSKEESGSKRLWMYDRDSQFSLLGREKRSYMWTHPLPAYLLEQHGLTQRPCPWAENHYKDLLILEKRHHVTPLEQAFLDELSAVLEQCRRELTF